MNTSAEPLTHAMTDGVNPSDDHEERGLAEAGNTNFDLSAGGVDLHGAADD